jgi:hypothetical protein
VVAAARRGALFLAALAAALALAALRPLPRAVAASEYEVKAAFLYNFTRFATWPPEAFKDDGAPLVIGVLGEDPFGAVLDDAVEGKTAGGRRVVARRYRLAADAREAQELFIATSEEPRLARILEALEGSSVLTVGEADSFAERGGAIGFVVEEKKTRFCVNLAAAKRARVEVSSQLLRLAKVVRQEEK